MRIRCPRVLSTVTAMSAAFLTAGGAAAGDVPAWTFGVSDDLSSATGSGGVQSDLAGFLIGDYDEVSNPGGTLTRPGIFGGSGNMPVDLDLGLGIGGDVNGVVSGGFRVVGDPASGILAFEEIELDLLSGATSTFPITASVLFETFRTFAPDSLFPGGVPVELPIGEATITRLELVQAGPAIGVTVPAGPDAWLLTVETPVLLVAEFSALGQILEFPPIPAIVPLTGEFSLTKGGGAAASLGFDFAASDEDTGPFEDPLLAGLPFGLPTVLPPGSTANILITATPSVIATQLSLGVTVVADGVAEAPPLVGDVDGDGVVDFEDVLLVLSSFGPCEPGVPCPTDVDGSEVVDFTDLLLVLANWTD